MLLRMSRPGRRTNVRPRVWGIRVPRQRRRVGAVLRVLESWLAAPRPPAPSPACGEGRRPSAVRRGGCCHRRRMWVEAEMGFVRACACVCMRLIRRPIALVRKPGSGRGGTQRGRGGAGAETSSPGHGRHAQGDTRHRGAELGPPTPTHPVAPRLYLSHSVSMRPKSARQAHAPRCLAIVHHAPRFGSHAPSTPDTTAGRHGRPAAAPRDHGPGAAARGTATWQRGPLPRGVSESLSAD